ncbi:MAG: hypothetical protein ACRCZE_05110 [Candidatus Altimarinota bacterium]
MEINNIKLGAWLLVSCIFSSENRQTDLVKIVEAGDYLNHAIFSEEELNLGLEFLEKNNLLTREGGQVTLRQLAIDFYKQASAQTNNVLKVINRMEELLVDLCQKDDKCD